MSKSDLKGVYVNKIIFIVPNQDLIFERKNDIFSSEGKNGFLTPASEALNPRKGIETERIPL